MAYGLNKVTLIGHLGGDPELRYTTNGVPTCSFRIATNESYKGADGNLVERTEWHNVVAFRKVAELLAQYLHKGSKVYVEGKLQTRDWDDKNNPGIKHYKTEIVLDEFVFLDSKGNGGGGSSSRSEELPEAPPASPDKEEDLPF
jgi:single-strand DNA-binding protein